MAIVVSEETKKNVKQLSYRENASSFTPVAIVDLETIAPVDGEILPASVWFAHDNVLYEFLTSANFTSQSHGKLVMLASKHPSFKLFVKTQDNVKFLRYVEERRMKSSNTKETNEQQFEKSLVEVKRKAENILTAISNMKITPELATASKEVVSEMVGTVMKEKKIVSLLMKMLLMDGNYLNHALATSMIATALAKHCGFNEQTLSVISQAALFHDIGTFRLPSKLVNNKGELNGDEFEMLKAHTVYGQEILDDMSHQGLRIPTEVEIVCLQHHEKFNGCGYPNRKKGRQEEEGPSGIHIYARIVAIADSYCELVEKSRKDVKLSHAEILRRMFSQDGSYDPLLLSKFKEVVQEV